MAGKCMNGGGKVEVHVECDGNARGGSWKCMCDARLLGRLLVKMC